MTNTKLARTLVRRAAIAAREYLLGYCCSRLTAEDFDRLRSVDGTERLVSAVLDGDEVREVLAAHEAEQAAQAVPAVGSPEASALIDSELAAYGWPANPKNAARAGYEACRKRVQAISAAPAPEATPAAAQVVALPDPPAFPVLASMAEQVRNAIDLHREGASTAQAIGVLEIVKQQLIQEQQ